MKNSDKIKIFAIITGFLLFFCRPAFSGPPLSIQSALAEANAKFTYKGKPIHPKLVQEFATWLSDFCRPKTISVDIAAAFDTNEYSDYDVKIKRNGYVYFQEEKTSGYFYYKWLGRLKNGLHVLLTGDSGGGSGVFMDIYFVKFSIDKGFSPQGQPYPRLLMSIIRVYPLQDRYEGQIEVLPEENKVILGWGGSHSKKAVIAF